MRSLTRPTLGASLSKYLRKKQSEIDAGADYESKWKNARSNAPMRGVVARLVSSVGRERCMYCHDSHGSTVDHFWPKSVYPGRTFVWKNFVMACSGCQLAKGNTFPLQALQPLLVNPFDDDPWDHLYYDASTDVVVARWNSVLKAEDPKGAKTLEILTTLQYQATSEGRGRTRRNLIRALGQMANNVSPSSQDVLDFLAAIRDNDEYGLGQWYLLKDGASTAVCASLRAKYPGLWQHAAKVVTGELTLK